MAISATGAGDVDGPVGTAQFSLYGGIEVSADETKIYVTDFTHGTSSGNKVKLLTNNTITTIAGKTGLSDGEGDAMNVGFKLLTCTLLDKSGGLYIADGFNGKINYPHGMVWDSKDNMFISNASKKIKKLTID